jgi:hypothetical protein
MFPLANVLHLFAHELARLRGRRLAFPFGFSRALQRLLFWHHLHLFNGASRLKNSRRRM